MLSSFLSLVLTQPYSSHGPLLHHLFFEFADTQWTNEWFTVETAPGTTVGALKATVGEKVRMFEEWFILKHSSIHLEDDRLVSAIRFRGSYDFLEAALGELAWVL